ncbi:MAG TPA: phage portal protein [Burkholderiaceae bacterium]|nr:phage portal protein [Burkholderiaceae bacterium]
MIARANLLDRLIGAFDPSRGLRRIIDRTRLQRAYEAASPRDTWKPRRAGASAQADHFADATILRGKARALAQNVPYIAAGMDALVANVIGTGIMTRFTGVQGDRLNTLWQQWVEVCDADGRLDLYGMQAAAYRAMEQDGEVLVRLRPRLAADRLPVPLQLQLLEIDWLDSTKNSSGPGSGGAGVPSGNVVVEGIEYDVLGRVAAYWLWDQHPGDATLMRGFRNFSKRLPATSIIHLYDPKRPGQARGITRLAPIIARTRDTQLLEDAHLARKNLEARLSVLVSGDASLMANEFQQGASGDAASATVARQTGDLGELASGSITELPAGNEVTFIDPKATPGHVEDIKHHLHIITAALGVTYESVTGDMSEATFSSARMRQNDVRRLVEHTQWMVFIPRFCRTIAGAFVMAAIDAGKVPGNTVYTTEYDCPKWDYVNPIQEAQADALQVAAGLSSISAKLRARGENPATVFAEIKNDFDTLRELGVLDILIFLQKGSMRDTEQDADPASGETPPAPKPAAKAKAQRSQVITREAPEVHVNIAPPQVEVRAGDTHVHMPEGMVRADIHTPEVKVGDVHVDVPAPQVTVQHPTRAVQVVERDPTTQEIKRTETKYET